MKNPATMCAVRVARKANLLLQEVQSELQQQPAMCAAGYFGNDAVSGSSGCTVCSAGKSIDFSGAAQCEYVGKKRMLLKVHRSASLFDAGKYSKKKAAACLPSLGEVESVSHVLRAHTALQMATNVRPAL